MTTILESGRQAASAIKRAAESAADIADAWADLHHVAKEHAERQMKRAAAIENIIIESDADVAATTEEIRRRVQEIIGGKS